MSNKSVAATRLLAHAFTAALICSVGCSPVQNTDERDLTALKKAEHAAGLDTCAVGSAEIQNSPLHLSAARGDLTALKVAAKNPADLDRVTDQSQWSPLMCAVASGSSETVEWLLSKNVAVDAADRSGKTPLLLALQRQRTDLAEKLLATAKVVDTVWEDQTVLTFAVAIPDLAKRHALLDALAAHDLKAIANRNRFREVPSPLASVAYQGDRKSFDLLLSQSNTALVDLTKVTDPEIRKLIEANARQAKFVSAAFGRIAALSEERTEAFLETVESASRGSFALRVDGNPEIQNAWQDLSAGWYRKRVGLKSGKEPKAELADAKQKTDALKEVIRLTQSGHPTSGIPLSYRVSADLSKLLETPGTKEESPIRAHIFEAEEKLAEAWKAGDPIALLEHWSAIVTAASDRDEKVRKELLDTYTDLLIDAEGRIRVFAKPANGLKLNSELWSAQGRKVREHQNALLLAHSLVDQIVAEECSSTATLGADCDRVTAEAKPARAAIRDIEVANQLADQSAQKSSPLSFNLIENAVQRRTRRLIAFINEPVQPLPLLPELTKVLTEVDENLPEEKAAILAYASGLLANEAVKTQLTSWLDDLTLYSVALEDHLTEISDQVARNLLSLSVDLEQPAGPWIQRAVRAALEKRKTDLEAEKKAAEAPTAPPK